VDGIGSAIADVISLVREDPGLDVLLLQETKLISANPTLTLPGYFTFRRDWPPGRGRGVGLLTYVKTDIPFCQIPAYREEEVAGGLEALAVEIETGARGKFIIINLYIPCIRESGQGGFNPEAIRVPATQHLLRGDFNAHYPLWDDSQPRDGWGTILEEWIMDNDLTSLNDGCRTRGNRATTGKSAPDVTLVHNSLVTVTNWKRLLAQGSEHFPLLCKVDVTYRHLAELDSKLKWDWRNADWENFQKEVDQKVSNVRPRDLRWSLKKRVTFFGEAILESAKNQVGMVWTRDSGRCWMTPALKAAMKRRNLLRCTIGRNREQWSKACQEIRSLMRCAKQNSWRTFVVSMKGKTSSFHVWSVIQSLNGKRSPPMARNTVLEHGWKSFVSDTVKADVFIKHYASVSRHKFSRAERKTYRVMRTRVEEDRRNPEPLGLESDKFSMEELVSSLKAGMASGAEGPDGLAPRFLKNLGEVSRSFTLDTFNKSWRKRVCPQAKDTVIVPILKPGKPEGPLDSYRPIALTSCIAKLMEHMAGKRLQNLAESRGMSNPDQSGFRPQQSTEDQKIRLSQAISDGFQAKKLEN
jgi:hypothetical protein